MAAQIGRRRIECLQMHPTVAHQHKSGIVGNLCPFVEVEGNRIRAFDTCKVRRQFRRHHRQRAERAIDVECQVVLAADVGKHVEIVDRTAIDAARGRDDEKGCQPRLSV
jgi:hypothetical protein